MNAKPSDYLGRSCGSCSMQDGVSMHRAFSSVFCSLLEIWDMESMEPGSLFRTVVSPVVGYCCHFRVLSLSAWMRGLVKVASAWMPESKVSQHIVSLE